MFTAERVYSQDKFDSYESVFSGLDGTAFDVGRQIEMLLQSRNLDSWCLQTQKDLEFLYIEFLAKLKVIPFDQMEIRQTAGGTRLYCPKYNKFFLETISFEERNGSTRFAVGQVHEFLLNAQEGSVAAFVSPPGWSGMHDSQNREYGEYPSTQIYVYRKNANQTIEAITFVINKKDMPLGKCEEYLEFFGKKINRDTADEKLRIEDIVSTPLYFPPDSINFEDFVTAIGQVCEVDTLEIQEQLQYKEDLSNINHTKIFDILQKFQVITKAVVTDINDPSQISWLKQFLIKTVLDMSAASRGVDPGVFKDANFYSQEEEYLREASKQGPCPPVGVTQGPGGSRIILSGKEILKCVRCPECGRTVDAEIYEGKIHCPSCGAAKSVK